MRVRILGCGTSTGVPVPGCTCAVCSSKDPKNTRLRTSALIELQEQDLEESSPLRENPSRPERVISRVLIDTGPDLRFQLLREEIRSIDSVLYTHTHADHIFGIDDLRGIWFSQGSPIAAYATESNVRELRQFFPYIFSPDPEYMGGAPPKIELHSIRAGESFDIAGVSVLPIAILHGKLEILGYRIGNFAYLTDCSAIPEESRAALQGLEVLCISGLRKRPHPTHLSLDEACHEVEALGAKRAYLIHLSHEVDFASENLRLAALGQEVGRQEAELPEKQKPVIELAYDGLHILI